MLQVELVSPEKILFSGQASFVRARTVGGGEIAFLTGHAPFIGALEICAVKIVTEGGDEQFVAVHGGFVEVSDDTVTILSDVAELAGDIDVTRAEDSRSRAESCRCSSFGGITSSSSFVVMRFHTSLASGFPGTRRRTPRSVASQTPSPSASRSSIRPAAPFQGR